MIGNLPADRWLGDARCRTLPLDKLNLFFVDAGRSLSREAKALCAECPVRSDCLAHAYDHDIASGYFGGMSPSRRRSLSRDDALTLLDAG